MKTTTWMLGMAALLTAAACGQKKSETAPKYLVLYYSQTTNTRAVAEEIADVLGADIEEIIAETPYDGDFEATIQRCLKEREDGLIPAIRPVQAKLDDYDVIFLGYPVWFGTYAPPVAAWLQEVDLSGKKVVPFCTFGSGGLDSSVRDLAAIQPEAEILAGYGVRAARMDAMPAEVDRFLKAAGFLEGEYTAPEAFPEAHPASEEEAAIFAASIADYPMMTGATAATATSRPAPNGLEYKFTALAAPRPDMPDAPAMEMTVFVLVEDGKAPVFTQVLR